MANIFEKSKISRLCFALTACVSFIVFGLVLWVLKDSTLEYFYSSNGVYGKANFNCKAFLVSLHTSLFLIGSTLIYAVIGIFGEFEDRLIKMLIFIFMSVSLILNVAEIIPLFVETDLVSENKLSDVINEEILNYFHLKNSSFLDTMQSQLKCCGITGWENYILDRTNLNLTPESCLESQLNKGCINELLPYINKRWNVLLSIHIIFIIFQLVTLASIIYPTLKKQKNSSIEADV